MICCSFGITAAHFFFLLLVIYLNYVTHMLLMPPKRLSLSLQYVPMPRLNQLEENLMSLCLRKVLPNAEESRLEVRQGVLK